MLCISLGLRKVFGFRIERQRRCKANGSPSFGNLLDKESEPGKIIEALKLRSS